MTVAVETPAVFYGDYPEDILLHKPKVRNDSDCDLALRELSFMAAHSKAVDAQIAEATNKLKEKLAKEFVYIERTKSKDIDGKSMTYDERKIKLTEAIEEYCDEAFGDIFDGKRLRSMKLAYGSFGYRKTKDSVDYIKGRNAKLALDAIERLTEKIENNFGSLMERLKGCVSAVVMFVTANQRKNASLVVTVAAKISLSKALESYRDDKLSREDLNKIGLKFVEGEDQFFCKPADYQKPE